MIPAIMGALGLISTGLQIFGGVSSFIGQENQSAALKEEEKARHKQFLLDFQRQRLEAVRQSIIARSLALAAGASQGALGSSSVRTGVSGTTNKLNYQLLGLQQNQNIGEEVFQARQDYFDAGGTVAFGQGLSTLGATITNNRDEVSRLLTYGFGKIGATNPAYQAPSGDTQLMKLGTIY